MSNEKGKRNANTTIDLFNNPMVKAARKSMSEETRKSYEMMGKHMFANWKYNENEELEVSSNPDDIVIDIESALRSGLDPKDLDEKERVFMASYKGEDWEKEYK